MEKQDEEVKIGESKKPKGWFSRRFQTSEMRNVAVGKYLAEHGREARTRKAGERAEARAKRSPKDQLAELDRRLGKDIGAKNERARLSALVTK